MARIIDLSVPIEDHFRWPVQREKKGDHSKGDLAEVTWLGWPVHGFTHMDSPRHFFADAKTTDDIPLDTTIGDATVFDLEPVAPNEAITAERLQAAGMYLQKGDIALMRTCWDTQRSLKTREFWTDAPYLTREAATWLLERGVRAVAFDFPQDYPIRGLLDGKQAPLEEHVTHDVLLRNGVILIEYVANTQAIRQPRVWFCCLPLKVPGADGAPARVIAIEGDQGAGAVPTHLRPQGSA
jgi:kynurenine formamidase